MKGKAILICICCILFFIQAKAQQKDDKRMSAVKIETDQNKNYDEALKLLGKISEEGRKKPDYPFYLAKANEGNGDFENAVSAYKEYILINPADTTVNSRISILLQKIDIRKNCSKCKGKGYTIKESTCGACHGLAEMVIPCPKCSGQKVITCASCDGSGIISKGNGATASCSSCGGSGKKECNRCNSTGTSTAMCKYCKGGIVQEKIKCSEHE